MDFSGPKAIQHFYNTPSKWSRDVVKNIKISGTQFTIMGEKILAQV